MSEPMRGPTCLPIFPLPDLTFFPHTVLPLHIFEPRYRSMVSDCLARNRKLAVVGLKPGYEDNYEGKPAVHAVAGAGEIVRCERLATGRFNILIKGESRIRIDREIPSDTLYRLVEATVLEDVGDGGARADALTAEIKARCRRVLNAVGRSSPRLEATLSSSPSPPILADQIASALIPSPQLRQRLLEETDVERRLGLLLTSLDRLLERLDRGR
jgi:Lon protease-like protein